MQLSARQSINSRHIMVLFILVYTICSIFSVGYYHADEHFQVIEFANYHLGGVSINDMAWEYGAQIRPGLQPFLTYLTFKAGMLLGIQDPYLLAMLLRFVASAFFLFVCYKAFKVLSLSFQVKKPIILLLLTFGVWYFPTLGCRWSSENLSAVFFLWGLLPVLKGQFKGRQALGTGLLWGCAFEFRFQIAFMILGALLYLLIVKKERVKQLLCIAAGGSVVLGVCVFVDYWLYGEWVFPPYQYFYMNIVEDVASEFGRYSITQMVDKMIFMPFASIGFLSLLAFLVFVIRYPKHVITWCVIPYLLIHFMVAHKELRFFFPLIVFLPIMIYSTYQWIAMKTSKWVVYGLCVLTIPVNIFALSYSIMVPANKHVYAMKHLRQSDKPVCSISNCNIYNPFGLKHTFYGTPDSICVIEESEIKNLQITNSDIIITSSLDNLGEGFIKEDQLYPDWLSKIMIDLTMSRKKMNLYFFRPISK